MSFSPFGSTNLAGIRSPIRGLKSFRSSKVDQLFNPIRLFRNAEEGTFLDFTTPQVYADTAGTDPAEVGEGIALALDKSQGLELGPELVTNGTFDTDTSGWTPAAGNALSVVDGKLRVTRSAHTYSGASATITGLTVGKVYKVEIDCINGTLAAVHRVRKDGFSGSYYGDNRTSGTYHFVSQGTSALFEVGSNSNSSTGYFDFDNISVRELKGVHALQATSTARPIFARVPVGGRRNLLERTEEFDNAYWAKFACTVADQGEGVWKVAETTASGGRAMYRSGIAGNKFSLEVKSAGNSRWLRFQSGTNDSWFNPDTGLAGTVAAGHTVDVVTLADGWYRVNLTRNTSSASFFAVGLAPSNATASYIGDGSSGILVRKPQAEEGSFTPYQKVVTQYDITEAGVPSVYHSVWDNTDDILPITLPAITGGTVALVGLNGIWIEDDWDYAGGTLSIGPTTIAGLPAGILDVVGDLCAVIINDRAWTAAERAGVVAWGKARGAPGVFGLGENQILNSTFDDSSWWTGLGGQAAITGGELVYTVAVATSGVYKTLFATIGEKWLLEFDMTAHTAGSVYLSVIGSSASSVARSSVGKYRGVQTAISTSLVLYCTAATTASVDNAVARKLELLP